eukprot:444599-Pleurochrysis_carterae.AAC.1
MRSYRQWRRVSIHRVHLSILASDAPVRFCTPPLKCQRIWSSKTSSENRSALLTMWGAKTTQFGHA